MSMNINVNENVSNFIYDVLFMTCIDNVDVEMNTMGDSALKR